MSPPNTFVSIPLLRRIEMALVIGLVAALLAVAVGALLLLL